MKSATVAKIALGVLTVAGALGAYQTLFSIWMSAHPLYQSGTWTSRVYLSLGATAAIAAAWLWLGWWLLRQRTKKG